MGIKGLLVILGGVVVFVALLMIESRRQQRKYGSSRGTSLLRAGMLEMQSILEPEKKVEMLRLEEKEDIQFAVRKASDSPKPAETLE